MSHTPGPWYVAGCTTPSQKVITSAEGGIAITYSQPENAIDPPVFEDNAHLIAAAPELLDALKTALGFLGGIFRHAVPPKAAQIEALYAVIAKAEGNS